jgi:hypothetical protein
VLLRALKESPAVIHHRRRNHGDGDGQQGP